MIEEVQLAYHRAQAAFDNSFGDRSMGKNSSSSATLRIWGDDLLPDEITKIFNCEPSQSQTNGQIFGSKSTGHQRAVKFGMWRLNAKESEPANLDLKILEIFAQLPVELDIWKQLTTRYDLDIFCGLFLNKSNDVVSIGPGSMELLSSKGVALKLDIYTTNPD